MECTEVRLYETTWYKVNPLEFQDTGRHLSVRRGMWHVRRDDV